MKRLIFTVFIALFLLALVGNASAWSVEDQLGPCNSTFQNKSKVYNFSNGCGSADYKCVIYKCSPNMMCFFSGPRWNLVGCKTPGNGTCCGYGNFQSCGYEPEGVKQCDSCLYCNGEGACSKNAFDSTFCSINDTRGFCASGVCGLDRAPPTIVNNQNNLYINGLSYNSSEQFAKGEYFNVDFSDDLRLKEFTQRVCDENSAQYFFNRSLLPAPVIIGNCAEETFPLSGKDSTRNWNMSREMWDFVLEKIANQGKMSVSLRVTDFVGNTANFSNLFYIVNDYTKPNVSIDHGLLTLDQSQEARITANAEDMLGEVSVEIFIDGESVKKCDLSPCTAVRNYAIGSEGAHSYYALVTDPSGNSITSETKTFAFDAAKTACADFFGQVCANGTICDQNNFKASDTEKCCPGTCTAAPIGDENQTTGLPTCAQQKGKAFNPSTERCSGEEVAAYGLSGALRCCAGSLAAIPQIDRLELSWMNSNGAKISSGTLGETVKCSAAGTVGDATFTITGPAGDTETKSASIPSSFETTLKRMGNYECTVEVGGNEKSAALRVVELPAMPNRTVMPVFGFFNVLSVLGILLVYYTLRTGGKNE